MQPADIVDTANSILAVYRDALLVDPFVKISLEICDGNFISECVKDTSAFSWKIRINPSRHNDTTDIQYSIVDSILTTMFDDFSMIEENAAIISEYRKRIISRLTVGICQMMDFSEQEEEIEDEG